MILSKLYHCLDVIVSEMTQRAASFICSTSAYLPHSLRGKTKAIKKKRSVHVEAVETQLFSSKFKNIMCVKEIRIQTRSKTLLVSLTTLNICIMVPLYVKGFNPRVSW